MVNGKKQQAADGETVLGLLEALGLKPQGTVVERNGAVTDRATYATTALADGDVLELIRFVGGG